MEIEEILKKIKLPLHLKIANQLIIFNIFINQFTKSDHRIRFFLRIAYLFCVLSDFRELLKYTWKGKIWIPKNGRI